MTQRLRIVVMGTMGQAPFAGIAWQLLHYLEGLKRLGHDVYYLEDTGAWPFDPIRNTVTDDCTYAVEYIDSVMSSYGMQDRWAYRSGIDNQVFGSSEASLQSLLEKAEVLINVTASTVLRDEHRRVPVRIYLETDPVLPEIEIAQGRQFTIDVMAAHTHHFTFGENLGAVDCHVPVGRFNYHPTRQPVVPEWWSTSGASSNGKAMQLNGKFTTIANWEQKGKDIQWDDEIYTWSKHHEFLKFVEMPRRTSQPLELALSSIDSSAIRILEDHGWHVCEALAVSADLPSYRKYIQNSRGEFTVAKDQNVRMRSGWFSDRSACYLAAGRPVITQDTGFGNILPTGHGLFAFDTIDEAVAAFEAVASEYDAHSQAAREIAEEYFNAEKVLSKLLDDLGF